MYELKGFPKAFVNFALDTIDIEGILKLVYDKDRACEFRNCLAYMDKEHTTPHLISNTVKGTLATEPRGEPKEYIWGRLWYIFIPEGKTKTLAEMTPEEFQTWKDEREDKSLAEQLAKWLRLQIASIHLSTPTSISSINSSGEKRIIQSLFFISFR